ncbi:MAG: copper chaperone PCu(A)C [Aquihabitans sp.]
MTPTRFRAAAVPVALIFSAGAFLAACGSDSDDAKPATTTEAADSATTTEAPVATEGEITFSGQWARTSPTMTSMGAVYLEITNGTDMDDALFAASVDSTIAGSAEIHENVMTDGDEGDMHDGDDEGDMHGDDDMTPTSGMGGGMMTMQEVDEIVIPAGDTVVFEPGGYHIMLMDLVEPLKTGDTFEVTLTFANGGDMVVEVEVRDSAA